jgi:curli production assembly/transport component CsgF
MHVPQRAQVIMATAVCPLWGLAALALAVAAVPAAAQDVVYKPIDPSFGGNPFNSSHLLGIANATNKTKDPATVKSNNTQAAIFAQQLQSRLLSALSGQIVDAIFGANPQQHGTISFGGQTIVFDRGLDSVTLTITDAGTGEVTTIVIPTFVNAQ